MNRRNFIRIAAMAGTVAAAKPSTLLLPTLSRENDYFDIRWHAGGVVPVGHVFFVGETFSGSFVPAATYRRIVEFMNRQPEESNHVD